MDPRPNDVLARPTLDLDDAFSDTGGDADLQFSPEAIREEMAKHMPSIDSSWEHPGGNLSPVSTLDIPSMTSQSPPQSKSLELSDHFSQISLSRSSSGQDVEQDFPQHSYMSTSNSEKPEASSYPVVVINASNGTVQHDPSIPESGPHSLTLNSPPLELPLGSALSICSLPNPETNSYTTEGQSPSTNETQATGSVSQPSSPRPSGDRDSIAPAVIAPSTSSSTSGKPLGHRHTRSTGPSAFEKVRSKTRPVFLPPKPRPEDDRHLADWHRMMEQSRYVAEKKTKTLLERRLARERQIEDSIHIWEKEITPDWRVVHKNPGLRKLWWNGIPPKHRAEMWEKAVGNPLALSKDNYRICLARAKKALSSNLFPKDSLQAIEEDILSTLPSLHLFHPETGPMYAELKEMLCAWVVARSDEGLGYTHGAAKLAAMLLVNMPAQKAFVAMRNLLERHCIRSFYGGQATKDDVEAYYRIFDTLLADGMPKIYFNFKQHQVSPASYLNDWLVPLFLNHLPFEACARIWDVILLEGDSFLYRVALAILAVLEPRLFFPDRRELLELLKGENKAAIEVAGRENRPLNGGKYEMYGLDDQSIWDRIDDMEEWWKESTWTRLLRRELPDI